MKSSQAKLNFDPQPIFYKAAPRDQDFFLSSFHTDTITTISAFQTLR